MYRRTCGANTGSQGPALIIPVARSCGVCSTSGRVENRTHFIITVNPFGDPLRQVFASSDGVASFRCLFWDCVTHMSHQVSRVVFDVSEHQKQNGFEHTATYHPVDEAVVSVTDQLPSLAHGIIDARASSGEGGCPTRR